MPQPYRRGPGERVPRVPLWIARFPLLMLVSSWSIQVPICSTTSWVSTPRAATRPRVEIERFRTEPEGSKHLVYQGTYLLMTIGISHQHPAQWSHFHRASVIAGRFEPGIFTIDIQEVVWWLWTIIVGLGLTDGRMQA